MNPESLREFLFWFDGFQENIKKQPSSAQWARVKQKFEKMRKELETVPATPISVPSAGVNAPPVSPIAAKPMAPEIQKQLAELKAKGRASGSGEFTGQAMSAGI